MLPTIAIDAGTPAGDDHPTVVVVGGGIAGLAAAWELTGGVDGPGPSAPRVMVIEEGTALGGKLRSEPFGAPDRIVDLGADGFLGRRPEAYTLCRELGLADELVPVGASSASIWVRGRLRPMPKGLVLGVPTRVWPTVRSGVLRPSGSLRLALDVVSPRPDLRGPLGDRAIGPLVTRKLGRQVTDTLVGPLVGGIHAGDIGDMSAAASFPLLLQTVPRRGSLMRALRRTTAGEPAADAGTPAFWAVPGGMAALVDRLAGALQARGVVLQTATTVESLLPSSMPAAPWTLQTTRGPVAARGVVLGVPAGVASDLLDRLDPDAAALLRSIDYASVAVVTLSLPADAVPGNLHGTGLLVPRGTPLPTDGREAMGIDDPHFLLTAVTYLSQKWPHLARPGEVLLRGSAGSFGDPRIAGLGDAELVARTLAELRILIGITGDPSAASVTRFDQAFPQYRVHHLSRVQGIQAGVARLGGLAMAGAAYAGVGIPACIGSGRAAGAAMAEYLGRPALVEGARPRQ